jgi:glycosyltransferase involved in cell wall biosynthesis
VYNRPIELERAVRSVLKQTVQDFEIIVVDDHSDVNLKQVIDLINDNRLKFIRLESRGNANVCRNAGLRVARGEYVAMLDSDDEWLPEHLEKKLQFLKKNSADGVFGSYLVNDGSSKRNVISRTFKPGEKMINYILDDGFVATPTHLYKTRAAKSVLWDEGLHRHQDYDFSVRFAKQFKFIPSSEVTCIVHWSKNEKRDEHFPSMMRFIEKFKDEIDPKLYSQYHRRIFTSIEQNPQISKKLKSHYRRESIRYINILTLTDYMSTFGINKNILRRIILRMEYYIKFLLGTMFRKGLSVV